MKAFVASLIFGLITSLFGSWFGYDTGYRDGQVDAVNGKIKYELQLQKDGTTAWKEKK